MTGLVAYALRGFIPLISPAYPVASCLGLFSMAVGLLNVSAIAIISEAIKEGTRSNPFGIPWFCGVVGTAV